MSPARASEAELVEAALEIGRGLAASAEPIDAGCTWHADVIVDVEDDQAVIGPGDVGVTLYDGSAGIGLGLAACAATAPGAEAASLAEVARAAERQALAAAPEMLAEGRLGLFDGAAGVALGAVGAAQLCGDGDLLEDGEALAREVAGRLEAQSEEAEVDLVGGTAGTMLGLRQVLPEAELGGTLGAAASRLGEAAVPQDWGAAWLADAAEPPLLGLAHGSAGIALALAETAALSGDADAWRACAEGVEYERGWFDARRVGWPDLRGHDGEAAEPGSWTIAWCHGAIGIGLSRLRMFQLLDDPVLVAEASAALQSARSLVIGAGNALRTGATSDCSPCHGLAGAVELLLVAGRAFDVPDHARAARRVAALLLEQRQAAGGAWPCGLPGGGEVPALMTGTAGIALTLLRVAGATDLPTPLLPGSSGW